ncbi:SH3 domain-containing protein [Planktothrix sp. FACHB-1355]|uniref:SH3 domain-containing protein n=1 Tax=Aerosakkonema funiforme FACHB-1375 TaxID=2949571 RepID=A0A926VAG9_9CYAN|nr:MULTISPECIES: SH3 domain-containing protein [Oscillatoriales]MBD2179940.1 SH3 domain-containing protein [Aerosakkonema funiforme FACHB-1375]MBD3560863.1 SH3 domain-containing protein [Planktothrix sp. FACHB-1355]
MKSQQFLIIILIAIGAITGSTLAAISYLNNRQTAPTISEIFPESTDNSTPDPIPDLAETAPTQQNSSPPPKASEFSQFRLRLLDAVKRRDAKFIRTIVNAKTQWGFGGAIDLNTYNIDNRQSPFWQYMEKAIAAGCTIDPDTTEPEQELGSDIWFCPITFGKQIYKFGWQQQVAILGQNVNVRSEPGSGSPVVDELSRDIIQFDKETFDNLPQRLQQAINSPDGWTPVVLKNGQKGWVQNRFVYYEPRDYRVSFIRSKGQWWLRYFWRGNAN